MLAFEPKAQGGRKPGQKIPQGRSGPNIAELREAAAKEGSAKAQEGTDAAKARVRRATCEDSEDSRGRAAA